MSRSFWLVALIAMGFVAGSIAGEPAPQTVLRIPFDGSADAAYSASGSTKTSYVSIAYRPGKVGQAAEIGSERAPCGLVVRGPGLFSPRRGSFAVWYKPLWNPTEEREHARTRTLITDERPALGVGHFWITIAQRAVHFAWRGRTAAGVSARLRDWQRGDWHHIIATWDSKEGLALYIDGERGAQRAMRWDLPPSDTLYIGANRRGLNPADGLLDELVLYDRALTAAEVEAAYVQQLHAPNAPVRRAAAPSPRPAKPRLTLHLPFDGTAVAKAARGKGKPVTATNLEYADGLLGRALVCKPGLDLAYETKGNLDKEAGAVTFWARSSFAATGKLGLLLADEQPPREGEEKPRNTLGLWLQRTGIPTIRFDMQPNHLERALFRWNGAEWYHFALCWRRNHELALYVNGRPVSRRTGEAVSWTEMPSTLLRVGSWQGKMPADAVLDDLRIYDAPLDEATVRRQAEQFLLPLVLQPRRTLLPRGRAANLIIDAYNPSADPFDDDITVGVSDPGGRRAAVTTTRIKVGAGETAEIRLALSKTALDHRGLYRISTASPKRVNPPVSYFLVVEEPKLPQATAEPKPKLKLLETIDCAKLEAPERLCHSGRSAVREAAGAQVREAGPRPDDRFAVHFTVEALDEPHLLVVTYPDDRPRSAEIVVAAKGFSNTLDVVTGYFSGEGASGKLVDLPIYFWPRTRENAVIFRTLELGRSAACATIAVNQVLGGLPPTRVTAPDDGGRPLGLWWREPAATVQFGARQVLAPDIYESLRRLTDYLSFSGQSLLCYPLAAETGVLYPSPAESFRQGAGGERHCSDWVEYALRLCERRGQRFLPELFLSDTFALSDAFGSHLEDDVAAGVATSRMVLWDGSLSRGGRGEAPRYTPAHRAVREAVVRHVEEIASRYGRSPALEGVAVHLGQGHFAWFGSLQGGYGDATVAAFEKATGTRVPADKTGAARFAQRARWLLANKREEWVAWRCKIVHATLAEAAARLARQRPSLRLYLNVALPDPMTWNPLGNLSTIASGARSLDDLYREAGLDLRLYAGESSIVVRRVVYPTDYRLAFYQGGAPGVHPEAVRDHQLLAEANAPFHPLKRAAAVCAYRPFGSSAGRTHPMKDFWWEPPALRSSYPTASGRSFLAPLARAVADLDALSLALGSASAITAGHETDVRAFARAYRALPRKPFTPIPGMADPVCARELRQENAHYVYLVNRAAFPVDAYLAFQPASVTVADFAAGKEISLRRVAGEALPAGMPKGFVSEHTLPAEAGPLPAKAGTQAVSGALLHVRLAPFELRSYRVLTPEAKVTYAASKAPVDVRLRLAQRIESAKGLVKQSKAAPDALAAARRTLALIERAWAKREIVRVEHLLNSYPIERLR